MRSALLAAVCARSALAQPTIGCLKTALAGNPISNMYSMTQGTTGTCISDGGSDMYDCGNEIYIRAGTPPDLTTTPVTPPTAGTYSNKLSYTNRCDGTWSPTGEGDIQYYTCKTGKVWIAGFKSAAHRITGFKTEGNTGADGYGEARGGKLDLSHGTYDGFWKTVHDGNGAGRAAVGRQCTGSLCQDPSINQLVMVPARRWHSGHESNTNNGQHWVEENFQMGGDLGEMGTNSIGELTYILFAGTDAHHYTAGDYTTIFNAAATCEPTAAPTTAAPICPPVPMLHCGTCAVEYGTDGGGCQTARCGTPMCCMAMTAQCLACAACQTVPDYCSANSASPACPVQCPVGSVRHDGEVQLPCGGAGKHWEFGGSAQQQGSGASAYIELTTDRNQRAGSAFQTGGDLFDSSSFHIAFDAYMGSNNQGADGIAFTVLDYDRSGGHATGGTGEGLGASGLEGYTIEFDTWHNRGFDAQLSGSVGHHSECDHTSLWFDGIGHTNGGVHVEQGVKVGGSEVCIGEMEDGRWHPIEIAVGRNGPGSVRVTVDGVVRLDMVVPLEMRSRMNFVASYGWTASTGGANNHHRVKNAKMIDPCITAPPNGGGRPGMNPGSGVSGDPFTTDAQGNKVQFFLPLQQEQHLLTCDTMQLYGRAMASGVAGDHQQWFDQFRIVSGGEELLKVQSSKEKVIGAAIDTDIDIVRSNATSKKQAVEMKPLTTMSVNVMKQNMKKTGGVAYNGFEVAVSQDAAKRIGQGFSETVDFTVGDKHLQFSSAAASKFASKADQALYAHLDLRFLNLNTATCNAGILAEIWGLKEMSAATTKMLHPSA